MSVALTKQITTALAQFSSETRLYALTIDAVSLDANGLLVETFAADDEVQGIGGLRAIACA